MSSFSALQAIKHENQLLHDRLVRVGLGDVRLATELEFDTYDWETSLGYRGREVRDENLALAADKAVSARTDLQRSFWRQRHTALADFGPREWMMFDILAQRKDFLVPLFGKTGPNGYYDGNQVLELKTKPIPLLAFPEKLRSFGDGLKDVFTAYNVRAKEVDSATLHLNYSFHDETGANLFDPAVIHKKRTLSLLSGIAYTMRAALPTLDDGRASGMLILHPGREGFMRLAPGRLELRFNRDFGPLFLEAVNMCVMAGALQGLAFTLGGAQVQDHYEQAKPVWSPVVVSRSPSFKVLKHMLEGCIMADDGSLEAPQEYLHRADDRVLRKIARELGCYPYYDEIPFDAPDTEKEKFLPAKRMANILNKLSLSPEKHGDGWSLAWPTNCAGAKDWQDYPFDLAATQSALSVTGLRQAARLIYPETFTMSGGLLGENETLRQQISPVLRRQIIQRPERVIGCLPK